MSFARAASAYWLDVFPAARRELRRWCERAEAIPDPVLRREALFTHRTKSRHSEGLAAFAVLAPRAHRPRVVRALVAFELILDYLDTVSEGAGLDDSLRLHRAFDVAVDLDLDPSGEDHYALHPHGEDGGYLSAQVAACREGLRALPSYAACREPLRRCARLSREAQSLFHALPAGLAEERIAAWAAETSAEIGLAGEGLPWWEVAAAGSSSLAVGSLIATASVGSVSVKEAEDVAAIYFPWAGALTSLLDSLVDFGTDPPVENLLSRYSSPEETAERLGAISRRALLLAARLRQGDLHRMIVAAAGGYYLAQPNAWLPSREPVARRVLAELGGYGRLTLAVHCARQGSFAILPRAAAGGRGGRPATPRRAGRGA